MIDPAPPQDFIGLRLFPIKYLPCSVCSEPVRIPDKFRMAKRATCLECSTSRHQ